MKRARVGVCGAGWWGQGWHLPHLHRNPLAQITAIVEPSPHPRSSNASEILENRKAVGKRYGAPTFESIEALIASNVELDGLLIATPHASHYGLATKAIDAGWHVLLEKPMTTDVTEARELANAARDSKKTFMVNNTANWRPQTVSAHDIVSSGGVGIVEHVSCSMHSPLIWLFDDPQNTGWVSTEGTAMKGNGFGWGQLSHLLAWIFKVTSMTPTEAYAVMTRSASSGADLTNAAVIKCGDKASISLSGAATVPGDAHGEEPVGKWVEVKVFGSEGMLTYRGDDQDPASGALSLRRRDGKISHQHQAAVSEAAGEGFLFENYEPSGEGPESLHAFIHACLEREYYNGADAETCLRTVQAIDAIYRSSFSGLPEKTL